MRFIIAFVALFSSPVLGAPNQAASKCLQTELNLWEQIRGRLPDPDEADLIIDACVKGAYEEEKIKTSKKEKQAIKK